MTNDGTMIGEICHIEAAKPDGKRFNKDMTNEARRSYKNLILFCGDHHTVVDADPITFTVEKLRQMKKEHEKARSAVAGSLRLPSSKVADVWDQLEFSKNRDLRPALMGRALGPADAEACPELPETAVLLRDLEIAYSTRLAGVPGAGKSVCVMQVAAALRRRGWKIFRARNPAVETLPFLNSDEPTLYIIDDAHLTPNHALREVEYATGPQTWLITTHNTAQRMVDAPGTTHLDPKRAVRTIAQELRAKRDSTLEIVRKVDASVGDKPFDETIERRLDAAEEAEVPWQFCFILGGGWTRAGAIASSARSVGADVILAAIAARQIASGDMTASRADINQIAQNLGIRADELDQTVDWLISNRLVNAKHDLRTPHQRFAAVLLRNVLKNAAEAKNTNALEAIINAVIEDDCCQLIGLRNLLQELRMGIGNWRFNWIVRRDLLDRLVGRCWAEVGEEQRNYACLLLSELQSYFDEWVSAIIKDDGLKLAIWINEASGQSAYGIGHLLGQMSMKDEGVIKTVAERVDLMSLAAKLSVVSSDQVFSMTELASNLSRSDWDGWDAKFVSHLDKDRLRLLATNWPQNAYLSSFAKLCAHLTHHDQAFGLELTKLFATRVASRLQADPVGSFHQMDDIFWQTLRLYDPLGIYKGKDRPTREMKAVGRHIAGLWTIEDVANKISHCAIRDMQSAAGLLLFIRKVDQKRFTAIVNKLVWSSIETNLAGHFNDLFHDADVFLSVCGMVASGKRAISSILRKHGQEITILTPRLAYSAPEFAAELVERGGMVGISNSHHFRWDWGAFLLASWSEERPHLIPALLAPHLSNAADKLSQKHPSWYEEALLFLRLLRQVHPDGFEAILSQINADAAKIGWAEALKGKANAKHAAAYLIHFSEARSDALGETARILRGRFPKSSRPPKKLLEELT